MAIFLTTKSTINECSPCQVQQSSRPVLFSSNSKSHVGVRLRNKTHSLHYGKLLSGKCANLNQHSNGSRSNLDLSLRHLFATRRGMLSYLRTIHLILSYQ